MCMACAWRGAWHVGSVLVACAWHVHGMLMARAQHVHGMFMARAMAFPPPQPRATPHLLQAAALRTRPATILNQPSTLCIKVEGFPKVLFLPANATGAAACVKRAALAAAEPSRRRPEPLLRSHTAASWAPEPGHGRLSPAVPAYNLSVAPSNTPASLRVATQASKLPSSLPIPRRPTSSGSWRG